jgi:putative tricarboxylic transport membrane protein
MRVRSAKDLLAGCLFLAFSAAFLILAQDYQLGSARRMGPGYFPVVLSLILMLIGLATVVRSLIVPGLPVRDFAARALALVTASVVLFGLLVQGAGLGLAVAALVLARLPCRPQLASAGAFLLAAALGSFCVLVFVKGLDCVPGARSWL